MKPKSARMGAPAAAPANACEQVWEDFRPYAEGELQGPARQAMEKHLAGCATCQQEFATYRRFHGYMDRTLGARAIPADFDQRAETVLRNTPASTDLPPEAQMDDAGEPVGVGAEGEEEGELVEAGVPLAMRMGGAPWWVVSVALHALVLAFAALVYQTLQDDRLADIITVTKLEKPAEQKLEEKEKEKDLDLLKSDVEVKPTDPTSNDQSNITVPEEILKQAELSDHFETPNEMDDHTARGNPDSTTFQSQSEDEPGGGGTDGPVMDSVIGVGGGGTPGTGGGFGGGEGTGVGTGKGSGSGSFGQRGGGGRKLLVARHGGSKLTESAVDKALEWLAKHQEPDGHWDCNKYEAKADPRTAGINGDAAVTGFALLAFLGAGHTEKVGKYRDTVKRGVQWLIKELNDREKTAGAGRWCSNYGSNYTQGVAALALAEAAGMSRNAETKVAAQKAIDGVVAGQIKTGHSDYQAWDYQPGGMTNDTSVTGWNIMALKSAKIAGLHLDMNAFDGAMNWIRAGQKLDDAPKGDGAAEYWEGGKMCYRGGIPCATPGQGSTAVMAAAALTRVFVGGDKMTDPGVAGPCNLMKKELPSKNEATFNLYYWYYATLLMFQKGGDHWKSWNEAMKPALVETQRRDGDFEGSWNPYFTEATGFIYGGRVQSTALGALCLEVYYRYLPVHK